MSTAQQQAFERALVNDRSYGDFESIEAGLRLVDVRQVPSSTLVAHSGCFLCEHASATIPLCDSRLLGP